MIKMKYKQTYACKTLGKTERTIITPAKIKLNKKNSRPSQPLVQIESFFFVESGRLVVIKYNFTEIIFLSYKSSVLYYNKKQNPAMQNMWSLNENTYGCTQSRPIAPPAKAYEKEARENKGRQPMQFKRRQKECWLSENSLYIYCIMYRLVYKSTYFTNVFSQLNPCCGDQGTSCYIFVLCQTEKS